MDELDDLSVVDIVKWYLELSECSEEYGDFEPEYLIDEVE